MTTVSDPELETVAWDLEELVEGDGTTGVDRLLDEATRRADAFAAAHAGKLAELDGPGLVGVMLELATIQDQLGRAGNYAALQFSTDTADPARGALLQKVQERATALETKLLFFELEWAALDDARAEELLAADGLDFCRHHLRSAAPLPRPPALRARGEGADREGGDRPVGLGAAVRGADLGHRRSTSDGGRGSAARRRR